MQLRDVAHARTGDKGDTSQISVIAYDAGDYAWLEEQVTAARCASILQGSYAAMSSDTSCLVSVR